MFTITTPKGERTIGSEAPCFVIAEVSANHNQDKQKAIDIIRASAKAGADAIKLQTYTPDTFTIDSDKEWFMVNNADNPDDWKGQKLYDLYKKAFTPWEWHAELQQVAHEEGLVFFSTPFDPTAVDFLMEMDVPVFKVASYECTDHVLLKKLAQTGKPIIMSVGFATEEEVTASMKTLRDNGARDIVLLYCLTSYLGKPDEQKTNLSTMKHIADTFDVSVGFSDNNGGIDIPVLSATMGAVAIEKHVVLSHDDDTLDARFSIDPTELAAMVAEIRRVEQIKGKPTYGCQTEQEKQNTFFRRSLFVVADMKKGEIFSPENVRSIRPSNGLDTIHYDDILGKAASEDIERGTPLSFSLVDGV